MSSPKITRMFGFFWALARVTLPRVRQASTAVLRRDRFVSMFKISLVLGLAHAAEAEVIGSGVGLALAAATGDVPGTILIGAKKRTASVDPLPHAGLRRIEAIRRPF